MNPQRSTDHRLALTQRFRRLAQSVCSSLILTAGIAAADQASPASADRQSLDDAWWTGPILAASAATLPQGHFLIEPYVYDVVTYARHDANGRRRDVEDTHHLGSQSYLLYGVTDRVTAGLIPRFGFNDVNGGGDSSGLRVGDLSLQAQYRLTQFREGSRMPTISLVVQETLPTGKHDRLGDRPSDGVGGGAWSTMLALYSQYYFWMPNGRILRTRLNVSQTFVDNAKIADVSVYGTEAGFRGRAKPGDSFAVNVAGEYSLTRNWVLALDLLYQRDASTRLDGYTTELIGGEPQQVRVRQSFGSSRRIAIAPAIEYNWSSRVGVIVGARWFLEGRNAEASITPVAAINMVY